MTDAKALPAREAMGGKRKIQLVLDREAQATLAALQNATGAGSMTEVMRDALRVYNSLRDMVQDGRKGLALVDRNAGEMQEIVIPSLMRKAAPIVKP